MWQPVWYLPTLMCSIEIACQVGLVVSLKHCCPVFFMLHPIPFLTIWLAQIERVPFAEPLQSPNIEPGHLVFILAGGIP